MTVLLTGPSEGGNERFAAEVITKGMKPLVAWSSWCRWLTQCTAAQKLSGGIDFDSNMSITTETL